MRRQGVAEYTYMTRECGRLNPTLFVGNRFNIFVGDTTRQPRILEEDEEVSAHDKGLVMNIPIEYRKEFERDIMNALRDISGVSTLASHPFLMNAEAVSDCFGTHESILSSTVTDFVSPKLQICKDRITCHKAPRWMHIDLSLTGDSTGIVIGFVPEFIEIEVAESQVEKLPIIQIDCSLEVRPPKGGEIMFNKIRTLIYKAEKLGDEYKVGKLRWISKC